MRKTTIYLPDDLRNELRVAARETGLSQAELIRRAVRAYLEDCPQPLPAAIGFHHGRTFRASDDESRLEEAWGARPSPT